MLAEPIFLRYRCSAAASTGRANGVGKSNLLDVITFLSSLADRPLVEAAMSVRSDSTRYGDVSALFTQQGEWRSPNMRFEAEMIVPREGVDELGQTAPRHH